jgi:type II secretory pathway predicted ATPase ExeA
MAARMYTDWFKLTRLPFRLRPDPDFLFEEEEFAPVFAALRSAADSGQGLLALVGEPDTGKSTLLHTLALERTASMQVARILQPNLTTPEILEAIEEQFGLDARHTAGKDPRTRITRYVAEERRRGRGVIILVDEAHQLAIAALRELYVLASGTPAPLVVLAGERTLLTHLAALDIQSGDTALLATLRLPLLGLQGIEAYVAHRLKVAGLRGRSLLDRDAAVELQRFSGGTPQLIHILADAALGVAEHRSSPRVSAADVREAAAELKWVEFSAREATGELPAHAEPETGRHLQADKGPLVLAEIDVHHKGRPLTRITLRPGRLTIGRSDDAGLVLDSSFVSRQHCQVITTSGHSIIEDLGSTNGLVINGRRRRMHQFLPGDEVAVGDYTLTYLETTLPQPD